jgi:D-cysteine desulfhydrase family pyridoxal phosphate-dependent enzyme
MLNLPRVRFAHLPTPVEPLQRLSAELGGPKLYVKRDDQTGLAFGGNKTRKLEFLVADAQANGGKTLITIGAVQSNHCRQTAAAATLNGLNCILVLVGDPPVDVSGNLLLDHLLGADIVWTDRARREECLRDTFDDALSQGKRPYLVPYGGSNPVGATAYAYAIKEMLEQDLQPDWIVFASSSGGTQAGMVAGARLFGYHGKILGISVDEKASELQARVAGLSADVAERLGQSETFSPAEVLVNDAYLGGGYGVMGTVEKEAIQLFAGLEGLLLDPVYTGRAAAGLVDLIKQGKFSNKETVLFWHTGGTPALFADRYQEVWR